MAIFAIERPFYRPASADQRTHGKTDRPTNHETTKGIALFARRERHAGDAASSWAPLSPLVLFAQSATESRHSWQGAPRRVGARSAKIEVALRESDSSEYDSRVRRPHSLSLCSVRALRVSEESLRIEPSRISHPQFGLQDICRGSHKYPSRFRGNNYVVYSATGYHYTLEIRSGDRFEGQAWCRKGGVIMSRYHLR